MEMSHFIVRNNQGDYMYHRRNTGHMYEDRTAWGDKITEARVFTKKSAATNSANQATLQPFGKKPKFNYDVISVVLIEITDEL